MKSTDLHTVLILWIIATVKQDTKLKEDAFKDHWIRWDSFMSWMLEQICLNKERHHQDIFDTHTVLCMQTSVFSCFLIIHLIYVVDTINKNIAKYHLESLVSLKRNGFRHYYGFWKRYFTIKDNIETSTSITGKMCRATKHLYIAMHSTQSWCRISFHIFSCSRQLCGWLCCNKLHQLSCIVNPL